MNKFWVPKQLENLIAYHSPTIQFNEGLKITDVSNCAILLCFMRYKGKTDFKEELLCYIDLPGRTTGSEIFRLLYTYFSEKDINWANCVGVCTDGAASMTDYRSGVQGFF